MTLVDSNVLIDFVVRDPVWLNRSRVAFARRAALGDLWIVDPVFAEVSVGFPSAIECAEFLLALRIARAPMSEQALFLAGRAFGAYRARGGVKQNVPPDFFIGAQAQVEGWTILSRDARRYRTYFPEVEVVGPE